MNELLEQAKAAYKNAYSPYYDFRVGAALLCKDGTVYTGCNVENACGTSVCAERVALLKAISEGKREFSAIAISCEKNKELFPCGFCRQYLMEFAPDLDVIINDGKVYKLQDLLPHSFGEGVLI